MEEQLLEAWRTSNAMNLLFIKEVPEEGMEKSLSRGRTIFQQLVHVDQTRINWLEIVAKDLCKNISALPKEASFNRQALINAFTSSSSAIEILIHQSWEAGGKVKNFKKGLIPFISYLIAHEAHHRGHAMLTLKQSGVKIPEALKWGLWEWNK